MNWIKRGLIWGSQESFPYHHSALQPTPILIDDTIRVYVGIRDEHGVSRIWYVDVSAENPSEVIRVSDKPMLDIGRPGTFDENGVVPCAVVAHSGRVLMYYAGYQLGQKVKFTAYAGLALNDRDVFTRFSYTPVLDRTHHELYFRVIHSALVREDGGLDVWYSAGSEFIAGRPSYDIRYTPLSEGRLAVPGVVCIRCKGEEHRVGRPYVIKDNGLYRMWYCAATPDEGYRLRYAESKNGTIWDKKEIGIDVSKDGWDSEMMCFPAVVKYKDKMYLFYNGNNYGEDGFGYAELAGEPG